MQRGWLLKQLTPIRGLLRWPGETTLKCKGLAHIESNWGEVFPDGWIWSQGLLSPTKVDTKTEAVAEENVYFVLTAGQFNIRPFKPKCTTVIGYRSPVVDWDFQTVALDTVKFKSSWDTRKVKLVATSWSFFRLVPRCLRPERWSWRRHLEIDLEAPLNSFTDTPLYVPTKTGFHNEKPSGCIESHAGKATVKVFLLNDSTKRKVLIEQRVIPSVALEFGASFRGKSVSDS